ncbi:DUF1707 and DUF4190 domain-containing protein [Glycomyces salinus]|uniref:DUF1707 and DUF4190 domain-containing protein n=1 Tax=Glycomyces salinus TaxID=980294 RepID=UPI0018EC70A5|nr:DUF1707 and DUF4190 domain-containing protein [Glycomyces salinus]
MPEPDPERMRVSNAEREAVAARLQEALEAGRLDLSEFDQRSRDLYDAQTYAEVNRLLEDLPSAPLAVPPSTGAAEEPTSDEDRPMENGMGIAALVTGILAMGNVMPFALLAIAFGAVGLYKVRQDRADNPAIALVGLLFGLVSIPLGILFMVLGVFYWW